MKTYLLACAMALLMAISPAMANFHGNPNCTAAISNREDTEIRSLPNGKIVGWFGHRDHVVHVVDQTKVRGVTWDFVEGSGWVLDKFIECPDAQ